MSGIDQHQEGLVGRSLHRQSMHLEAPQLQLDRVVQGSARRHILPRLRTQIADLADQFAAERPVVALDLQRHHGLPGQHAEQNGDALDRPIGGRLAQRPCQRTVDAENEIGNQARRRGRVRHALEGEVVDLDQRRPGQVPRIHAAR